MPLLALIGIGIFLWRRHRRRREVYELDSYAPDSAPRAVSKEASMRMSKHAFLQGYEAAGVHAYELDSVTERVELPLKSPRELPGSEGERQRYQAHQPTTNHGNSFQPG